jgi:hypothetical protein
MFRCKAALKGASVTVHGARKSKKEESLKYESKSVHLAP